MIHAWGVTDKGVIRNQNQDGYYLDVPSEHLAVGVVCDGMGGAKAGNIASLIAVDTFVDTLKNLRPEQETAPAAALDRAAAEANAAVFRRACTDPDCRGMGTTMVAALIVEDTAYLLNIGDSRRRRGRCPPWPAPRPSGTAWGRGIPSGPAPRRQTGPDWGGCCESPPWTAPG